MSEAKRHLTEGDGNSDVLLEWHDRAAEADVLSTEASTTLHLQDTAWSLTQMVCWRTLQDLESFLSQECWLMIGKDSETRAVIHVKHKGSLKVTSFEELIQELLLHTPRSEAMAYCQILSLHA